MTSKETMVLYNLIKCRSHHDLVLYFDAVLLLAKKKKKSKEIKKTAYKCLLLQFKLLFKSFRQGFETNVNISNEFIFFLSLWKCKLHWSLAKFI